MTKKRQQVEQPARPDGWYWLRLFIPLRGGHYHHSWEVARVEGRRVQLWGSDCSIPLAAPVLQDALWSGPIDPPPLDEPPRTALALQQADNRRGRQNRRQEEPAGFTEAEKTAVKIRLLAEGLVDAFVQTSRDLKAIYQRHPAWRKEVQDRVAGLLEQAFGQSEEP